MARPDDETRLGMPDEAVTLDGQDGGVPAAESSGLGVGDSFGSRYQILRELGVGGMGVVYQAWDQVLNVVVALKVIRPETTADPSVARDIERRFKRELLLARKVTHKNVVRIHDLGDVGGTKYISMPFVEGDDLATTLKREGRLPVPTVLQLARQLASGLEAAHEAGGVHRDLKPANIMLDADGQALIMDFGIALSSAADARPAGATAASGAAAAVAASAGETLPAHSDQTTIGGATVHSRSVGSIVGTLDYMSPEQSKGETVDHRSDIYSLGLILRDLLVGPRKTPEGSNAWEAMRKRVTTETPEWSGKHTDVPADLDAIILRCLQLNPAQRFETTHELVEALGKLDDEGKQIPEPRRFTPRLIATAALLLAAVIGGTFWLASNRQPAGPIEPVSVLVADFTNSTNDATFNGLIESALTVGIEGATFIDAYPRRDAMRLVQSINKDAGLGEENAKLVSIREGIDVIVAGGIERSGEGYKLNVKVTRPADGQSLLDWSTSAADKNKVLDAVAAMSARVRSTLGDTKSDSAAQDGETFTAASLDAAKAYAEGQEFLWAGKAPEAIAAYQRTIQIDPNFGRAHSGLASLYANLGRTQEAEASFQAALALLDRMTEREKFRTRGGYYLFKQNGDKAMEEFQALVAQYPADTSGLANLAFAYLLGRDTKMALQEGLRASDAYPQNVIRKNNAALYAMYAGNFDESSRLAAEVLKLNPQYVKAFVAQGMSHLARGNRDEAVATYERLRALDSRQAKSFAATGLIDLALYEGRQQDALKLLEAAINADRETSEQAPLGRRLAIRASVLAARGDKAGAIRDAEAAIAAANEHGILFTAGRALIEVGRQDRALEVAADLDNRLEDEPRVFSALLRSEVALAAGRVREALTRVEEAQALEDTWFGRFALGRAYLALNAFREAAIEFDLCLSRNGEVTALFLDDHPTYRLLPPVYYYLGRAREGQKLATANDTYKTFLDIKARGDEQGLVADARKRIR